MAVVQLVQHTHEMTARPVDSPALSSTIKAGAPAHIGRVVLAFADVQATMPTSPTGLIKGETSTCVRACLSRSKAEGNGRRASENTRFSGCCGSLAGTGMNDRTRQSVTPLPTRRSAMKLWLFLRRCMTIAAAKMSA